MKKSSLIAYAPGRINLIGEHTDYNNGLVLPAAIDKKTIAKFKINHSNICRFTATNLNEKLEFDLRDFQPIKKGWQNYVMGVVAELQNLGGELAGFDCEFGGNVPIGSGMSSSAALECSLAVGLNELFDLGFDKWQLIKAAQMAEHHFVGIQCGIMDQFASIMGKKNQVILLDCQSLEFQYFPFDLANYQLLLLNTNVTHSLANSEYNARKKACETGVARIQTAFPSVQSLRDVTMEMLHSVADKLTNDVFRPCRHVVLENKRVEAAAIALTEKDFVKLGELIYQSHDSLQNDYEVSCPELDYLVDWTKDKSYVLGSRMMGGGFGGCTINILEKSQTPDFINQISTAYLNRFQKELTPYFVSIENGAAII